MPAAQAAMQTRQTLAPHLRRQLNALPTSSYSMPQIHMLAFGMKLRLGCHLAVGLFHFATAAAANDQVCAAGFPFIPGAPALPLLLLLPLLLGAAAAVGSCCCRRCWEPLLLLLLRALLPLLLRAAAAVGSRCCCCWRWRCCRRCWELPLLLPLLRLLLLLLQLLGATAPAARHCLARCSAAGGRRAARTACKARQLTPCPRSLSAPRPSPQVPPAPCSWCCGRRRPASRCPARWCMPASAAHAASSWKRCPTRAPRRPPAVHTQRTSAGTWWHRATRCRPRPDVTSRGWRRLIGHPHGRVWRRPAAFV